MPDKEYKDYALGTGNIPDTSISLYQPNPSSGVVGDRIYQKWTFLQAKTQIKDYTMTFFTWGNITGSPDDNEALELKFLGKQNTLTFDNVPTDGSLNPVYSNGVFDAIANAVSGLQNQEQVEDLIGTKIIGGANISVSYNDTTGETTVSTTGLGTGNVIGAPSSVNNNVVFFDGTTGKVIKDSGLTLSGTNTGDETTTTIKTKLGAASTSQDGYLTQADWNTFNDKQNALGYTAENVANKATTMIGNTTSNVLYLTAKAVFDWGIATFQALNANLTAISGITTAANKLIYWTGSGTAASTDITSFARSVIAKNGRATMGDADYAIPSTVAVVSTSVTLTAQRTATLPLANTLQPGERIIVDDGGGFINGTNRLIVAANGTDTINGNATELLQRPKGRREFISNGVNMWSIDSNITRNGWSNNLAYTVSSQNLADNTSYYSGWFATANLQPSDGNLGMISDSSYTRYELTFYGLVSTTLASNEDMTLYLRKNISSSGEVTIGTVKLNSLRNIATYSGICSIAEGDHLSIRALTPVWATNPTGVLMYCQLRLFK